MKLLFLSASFEESIEALKAAEHFNYSTAFGIPPYSEDAYELNSEEAPLFCSWVNRSVFEFFNKADSENVMKSFPYSSHGISWTRIIYALEVKPERNITVLPVKNIDSYTYSLLVVDDAGKELINTYNTYAVDNIAIHGNETCKLYSRNYKDIPQMNLTNHKR